MPAKLYPAPDGEEAHWFTRADYAVVVRVTRELGARTVLEFGPGTSTLALIEGGATSIDACEDDPHYFAMYRIRLEAKYPGIVQMHAYKWAPLPNILGVHGKTYDLALVDGPRQTERRAAIIVYAMEHCARVLVPLEEGSGEHPRVREVVVRFAGLYQRPVEWIEGTGPLAGAFALIGPA